MIPHGKAAIAHVDRLIADHTSKIMSGTVGTGQPLDARWALYQAAVSTVANLQRLRETLVQIFGKDFEDNDDTLQPQG